MPSAISMISIINLKLLNNLHSITDIAENKKLMECLIEVFQIKVFQSWNGFTKIKKSIDAAINIRINLML